MTDSPSGTSGSGRANTKLSAARISWSIQARRADQLGHLHLRAAQLAEVARLRAPQRFVEIHRSAADSGSPTTPTHSPGCSVSSASPTHEMAVAVGQAALALDRQIEVLEPVVALAMAPPRALR